MTRKTSTTNKPVTDTTDLPIKALRSGTCKTLSGSTTITYEVGHDDQERIFLRIADSSGAGNFSMEWILFTDIQAAFEAWPEEKPINAMTLRPLFYGASINTPGFLIAALRAEKLLAPMPKKKRCHVACDPTPFLESFGKRKTRKAPARKKAPAKAKRSAPRKKSPPAKRK